MIASRNREAATRAAEALDQYRVRAGLNRSDQAVLEHLVTDLLHLATFGGLEVGEAFDEGLKQYRAERNLEFDDEPDPNWSVT